MIGSHLSRTLLERGHTVVGLSRHAPPRLQPHPRFRFVAADTTRPGPWQEHLQAVDAVVNLAGQSIFGRWSDAAKARIRASRILTTRHVVDAMPPGRAVRLISASGAGYYGSRGEEVLTEEAARGHDFLADLCREWEAEAARAESKGARPAIVRLGVVLSRDGGALAQMIPPFTFFVGGPMGDGRQWFPWIHIDDLIAALIFLLEHPQPTGAFNLCAPVPVRNRELAAALGRVLSRPAFMPAPAFVLRIILGEFAEVLLASQRTVPARLDAGGFTFRCPDIDSALRSLLGSGKPARG